MIYKLFILNGIGKSGKDTFVEEISDYYSYTTHLSTITPIKEVASKIGWDGNKDEKGRQFLCELKNLCTKYYDTSIQYLKEQLQPLYEDNIPHIIFIDCREPKEIKKLVKEFTQFNPVTILIDASKRVKTPNNKADKQVYKYKYDIVIPNNKSLIHFYIKIQLFLQAQDIINKTICAQYTIN